MMMDAYTDHGTVIGPNEFGLITTDGGTRLELLVPGHLSGDDEVPPYGVLLFACMLRSSDEDFVDEMIEWFQAHDEP